MDAERFQTRRLVQHERSDPVAFTVPLNFPNTFIGVLALHEPGQVLGGTPPTFLIKAGVRAPTPCPSGATTSILGSAGTAVAEATVQRDGDTYLVTVDHQVPSGPWSVAIRNDESLPQTFYGVIADEEGKTRQPRAIMLDGVALGGFGVTKDGLNILNVGTATLEVLEKSHAGDRFGPPNSPLTIVSLPGPIRPHRIGTVVVQCPPLEAHFGFSGVDIFSYTLPSNDIDPIELVIRVEHPELFCKRCFCRGYEMSVEENHFNICARCDHTTGDHGIFEDIPDGPVFEPRDD